MIRVELTEEHCRALLRAVEFHQLACGDAAAEFGLVRELCPVAVAAGRIASALERQGDPYEVSR